MPARSTKSAPVSQKDLASFFDVDVRTIRRWTTDGIPRTRNGRYALKACVAWVREKDQREARERARPEDYDDARKRKMAAEAELIEYDLMERRGELMTVEQFDELVSTTYGRVRAALLALPARMAPDVVGLATVRDARSTVKRFVGEVMETIADEGAEA